MKTETRNLIATLKVILEKKKYGHNTVEEGLSGKKYWISIIRARNLRRRNEMLKRKKARANK